MYGGERGEMGLTLMCIWMCAPQPSGGAVMLAIFCATFETGKIGGRGLGDLTDPFEFLGATQCQGSQMDPC
jgi:hypothetical protein